MSDLHSVKAPSETPTEPEPYKPTEHTAQVVRHPRGKGAWYFTSVEACVICGRERTTRERQYSERPADPAQRFEYHETGCPEHFV